MAGRKKKAIAMWAKFWKKLPDGITLATVSAKVKGAEDASVFDVLRVHDAAGIVALQSAMEAQKEGAGIAFTVRAINSALLLSTKRASSEDLGDNPRYMVFPVSGSPRYVDKAAAQMAEVAARLGAGETLSDADILAAFAELRKK